MPVPLRGRELGVRTAVLLTSPLCCVQVNATPYLYSVPPDLACFSALLKAHGVRESFGSTDFVQVGRTGSVRSPRPG